MTMWRSDDDEFYVGYAPPMPPRLARFVRRAVVGLAGGAATWAVIAVAGHVRLDGGTFEFGHPQTFRGTISVHPYPALRIDDSEPGPRALLLVAPGKHGADALVQGLDGRHVALMGTRIARGSDVMIEIESASIRPDNTAATGVDVRATLERLPDAPLELTGEIVDSKCFLGVMVPGSGKTHKDCAALCLRGGIPPVLHVEDRSGHSALLLLSGSNGDRIDTQAVEMAGEPVSMSGSVENQNGWLTLRTDPASWRRLR